MIILFIYIISYFFSFTEAITRKDTENTYNLYHLNKKCLHAYKHLDLSFGHNNKKIHIM
jgi:hypothetical protein